MAPVYIIDKAKHVKESSEVEGFRRPKLTQIKVNRWRVSW